MLGASSSIQFPPLENGGRNFARYSLWSHLLLENARDGTKALLPAKHVLSHQTLAPPNKLPYISSQTDWMMLAAAAPKVPGRDLCTVPSIREPLI